MGKNTKRKTDPRSRASVHVSGAICPPAVILSTAKDLCLPHVILSTAKDLCLPHVILSAAKDLCLPHVILSTAKDLSQGKAQILRCAQSPPSVILSAAKDLSQGEAMTAVLTFKPLGIALLWLCHDMIAIGLSPFICRRTSLLLEHRGKTPNIHPSAYIAPTATICGDVTIGENSRVLFGAILVAEGGSVEIGANCIIMENAIIRGTPALQNVPNL